MEIPKPYDPQNDSLSPSQIASDISELLAQNPNNLHDEAQLLTRAHSLLHDALS
ncbi:hypothetical protein CDHC01_1108 [Corynebacterium diphtheriae HC01]|uniref:Uncharacterized protein n=1 Tax=Corynebacterium diphtheriae (strain ATCC 700971 / NCTC 13129 / Biotype gravis) TaxID=257309 RepID=Q6NHF9_CORDI|nr:hypothetical protein [Corynebacterium diphtheriae]AEX44175.1 hypothetical protein CD241_1110 [Corynebacterium diphtheriae 241]AEX69813.1 hypothetical protein CDPW8_1158 [Corynebacterium diphtheriae PW8]AEX74359.1 hypothetical protein CDHC01_1108 [Corynebacterium diphtheriae HC01]AEX78814.1 hypothetical protein CDHC03_1083 [Corynebacterium diphtheriae HC03]AWR15928.1 hypothetical protein B11Q_01244 [Corynebacterium diphtheriae]